MNKKIYTSASTLEAFHYAITQGEISVEDYVHNLLHGIEQNDAMRFGKAFDSLIKEPARYFIPKEDKYLCEGYGFDRKSIDKACSYINYDTCIFDVTKHVCVPNINGFDIDIRCSLDALHYAKVIEIKTTKTMFNGKGWKQIIEYYTDSVQGKLYCYAYDKKQIEFIVYIFNNDNTLEQVVPFTLDYTGKEENDIMSLLQDFTMFVIDNKLEDKLGQPMNELYPDATSHGDYGL